ncbi:Hsp20/alpha crystallin family protein [Corynebacterium nuruki]|jgi:HSP20 family protein|uniref:Hsp20/alpha crystallin family protein n=1 Tax=Corynebacterium nuruki TaxID=1032851 RepID=A0A3D4SVB4_9CORY|nr:Hsp20/alpha crystallin family protein [Corynebacterium nuruki]HCT13218.1 Hsp20/alpha crystallin family protein [Corynebacterium nuruki]
MATFRFDPFSQLDHVARELFADTPANSRTPRFMPMDLVKKGESYELTTDLPGVDPKSIDVDIDNGVLTISAERTTTPEHTEGETDGVKWIANERFTGSYRRQVTVGDTVDTEAISADYRNGVLTVTLPFAEKAKSRKVTVNHAESIEAASDEGTADEAIEK